MQKIIKKWADKIRKMLENNENVFELDRESEDYENVATFWDLLNLFIYVAAPNPVIVNPRRHLFPEFVRTL